MLRRLGLCALLGGTLLSLTACGNKNLPSGGDETSGNPVASEPGNPLYEAREVPPVKETTPGAVGAVDPIPIECHLVVPEKQDVSCEKDGILDTINVKEGEKVEPGQLLATVKADIPRDEVVIAQAKVNAAVADQRTSEATRDEAEVRYHRQEVLWQTRSTSREDLDAAKLTWVRYKYEAISKAEQVKLAESERDKAATTLKMYEIRSAIHGVIKAVYKKKGEAIKSAPAFEPVFQIQTLARLRAEGQLEKQYLHALRSDAAKVVIEAPESVSPQQTLIGHLADITGVAVNRDGKTIVSSSTDGTVRVWDRASRSEKRVLRHPDTAGAVRAIACTPPGSESDWCLSGTADGKLWLWDLGSDSDKPLREFKDQHRRAVTCVTFTPDGKACASGSDDMDICMWNPASGELRYRFPTGHHAGVTSLQFTPQVKLVSAGRDNTLRVWTVGEKGARLDTTIDRRSGDVAVPGVSPDGRRVLYDQGKTLTVLTLPEGLTRGVLQSSSGANNFTTFALFSPDGRFILTAGPSEGRLQLWQTPAAGRGPEVRELLARDSSPATCAAFAPDGTFLVTGTRDHQVLVWPVPTKEQVGEPLPAKVTWIDQSVESEARKVRIWAELDNPDTRLLPGDTVTLVIYPKE